MFPNESCEKAVVEVLLKEPGRNFNILRHPEPGLLFQRLAHSEVVLACLHSLSKRNEDISWVCLRSPFPHSPQHMLF